MTTKRKLPTVGECIAYIESTDYKLTNRGRMFRTGPAVYVFASPGRPPHCRELSFTLAELRDTWANGF